MTEKPDYAQPPLHQRSKMDGGRFSLSPDVDELVGGGCLVPCSERPVKVQVRPEAVRKR